MVVAICSGANTVTADENVHGGISPEMSALEKAEALQATIPAPPNITPPKSIAEYELKYITELYAAYGEAENILIFSENSQVPHPDYDEDLHDRRIDYFAAYAPGIVVVDSPVSQLSESEYKEEVLEWCF